MNDSLADFTNYGSCVDIIAPGVDVLSLENTPGGKYITSGTSMAAPHVAGVLALALSDQPFASVDAITKYVLDSATHDVLVGDMKGSKNLLLYNMIGSEAVSHNPTKRDKTSSAIRNLLPFEMLLAASQFLFNYCLIA